jgi:hypothetical protein
MYNIQCFFGICVLIFPVPEYLKPGNFVLFLSINIDNLSTFIDSAAEREYNKVSQPEWNSISALVQVAERVLSNEHNRFK